MDGQFIITAGMDVARDRIEVEIVGWGEGYQAVSQPSLPFKVGDHVTRDGTDVHRITAINECGDVLDVVCIREPLGHLNDDGTRDDPWIRIGETESNLARRYAHAGDIVDQAEGLRSTLPDTPSPRG